MEGENEDLDDFMEEVSSKYSDHFSQLDQIIDAESEVKVFGIADHGHIKALVRVSSMTGFLMALIIIFVHWISFKVDESVGNISSFESLLIIGLFFLNVGIYSVSIAERVNLIIMKFQLKLALRKTKPN